MIQTDKCCWPRCKERGDAIGYLGKSLCWDHWYKYCEWEEEGKEGKARKKIGLEPRRAMVKRKVKKKKKVCIRREIVTTRKGDYILKLWKKRGRSL